MLQKRARAAAALRNQGLHTVAGCAGWLNSGRRSRGVHKHRRPAHGLQQIPHLAGQGRNARAWPGSGKDAAFQVALFAGVLNRRRQTQHVLFGYSHRNLVEVRQLRHRRIAQNPLHIGGDINPGVHLVSNHRGQHPEKQPCENQQPRIAQLAQHNGVRRRCCGRAHKSRARRALFQRQVAPLFIHRGETVLQAIDVDGQIVGPLHLRCRSARGCGQLRQLPIQPPFHTGGLFQIGAQF